MKVLFIDIDGPLIPARALFLPENTSKSQWTFDPCAVGMLNFLFHVIPDLHAVISSHRVGFHSPLPGHSSTLRLTFWKALFEKNSLNARFHDDWITPRWARNRPKVLEIGEWLKQHPEVTTFAVIEDNFNGYIATDDQQQKEYNVFAQNYSDGLTYDDFTGVANALGLKLSDISSMYWEYRKENVK